MMKIGHITKLTVIPCASRYAVTYDLENVKDFAIAVPMTKEELIELIEEYM